jgi:hypothetical protein
MSIDVTWPEYVPIREKMEKDCLKEYFSSDTVKTIIKSFSQSDKRRLFEFIAYSGHHVNPELL